MCGIAGYVDWRRPAEEKTLLAMERALTHRGPDEGKVWREGPCGLVHRRLRIIDLSPAASQPMANEDGQLLVVFNGEIYNFRPLREELLACGHRFRSASDTEVIVHGYETWGLELFRRLRGMFAIAVWDRRNQTLVLARDRLGKKPLFYLKESGRLVFGSELAAFRCLPDFRPKIAQASLREYIEYGYVQSPHSILEKVLRLPAGYSAVYDEANWRMQPFWSLPTVAPSPRPGGGTAEAATALQGPLREAVACRLESDVPLGCFLSGGIDSSLVAALAQESLKGKLQTYTVGFENSSFNEADFARKIAAHLGTNHHELMLSQHAVLSEFEAILSLAPEPIGDDSFVPTYLISRATRQHVTVAISGDGGDELFAGYQKYFRFGPARALQRWLPLPWERLARFSLPDRWTKSLEGLAHREPRELARWLSSIWKRSELADLLASPAQVSTAPDAFAERWEAHRGYGELERWMLTDMETYLEGDILTKVDRASMAVGLEARSPFLDHHFIEEALKWECHAEPGRGGKSVLKTLLAQYVPAELFLRPKQGFGMPINEWFRAQLRPVLLRYTHPERIRRRGLFHPAHLARKVDEHLAGRRDFGRKLYAIVAFEVWADRFFGDNAVLA